MEYLNYIIAEVLSKREGFIFEPRGSAPSSDHETQAYHYRYGSVKGSAVAPAVESQPFSQQSQPHA